VVLCRERARVYFFCSARPILAGERSDQVSLEENAGVRNANLKFQKLLVGLGGVGPLPAGVHSIYRLEHQFPT
jgi:hypothetical protein